MSRTAFFVIVLQDKKRLPGRFFARLAGGLTVRLG